jgi:hypothetical protein
MPWRKGTVKGVKNDGDSVGHRSVRPDRGDDAPAFGYLALAEQTVHQ